jgi:hypothetical protein
MRDSIREPDSSFRHALRRRYVQDGDEIAFPQVVVEIGKTQRLHELHSAVEDYMTHPEIIMVIILKIFIE